MADEGDKTDLANSKQSVPSTCAIRAFNDVAHMACVRIIVTKLKGMDLDREM